MVTKLTGIYNMLIMLIIFMILVMFIMFILFHRLSSVSLFSTSVADMCFLVLSARPEWVTSPQGATKTLALPYRKILWQKGLQKMTQRCKIAIFLKVSWRRQNIWFSRFFSYILVYLTLPFVKVLNNLKRESRELKLLSRCQTFM